jgi:hypothetical protein
MHSDNASVQHNKFDKYEHFGKVLKLSAVSTTKCKPTLLWILVPHQQ